MQLTHTHMTILLSLLLSHLLSCSANTHNMGQEPNECPESDVSAPCTVFRLVNKERVAAGLSPYSYDPALALCAKLHAQDMVQLGYFDHKSKDGRSFSVRARNAGYTGFPSAENIAQGQQTPESVMQSWMTSPGHKANILSKQSNEIGVGLEDNTWVQVFGNRN